MVSILNIPLDETGQVSPNIASRLITLDDVKNTPDKVKETLYWMMNNGFSTFNYVLGE